MTPHPSRTTPRWPGLLAAAFVLGGCQHTPPRAVPQDQTPAPNDTRPIAQRRVPAEARLAREQPGEQDSAPRPPVTARATLAEASAQVAQPASAPAPARSIRRGAREDALLGALGRGGAGVGHGTVGAAGAPVVARAMKVDGPLELAQLSAGLAAPPRDFDTEAYAHVRDNPFEQVADSPLSTFSIDVDTASYSNVRRFLRDGERPPADAVRIEELLNYFRYDDPAPAGDSPFSVRTEIASAPWNPGHRLVRIALRARTVDAAAVPPRNLVFLVDVSGSMQSDDKLPLLQHGLALLARSLRPEDRIAIAVYAGASGLALPPTRGDAQGRILEALARLEAGGSTNGAEGIELAYDLAGQNFVRGGINRVILATDGDFNVGVTSHGELVRLVEEKRKSGVFLTVLGFGTGNLKDSTMEALADHGNGNYAYVDSLAEARKVLVREAGSTLVTVAKDVKLQLELNPARVASYRLIGYENRLLAARDFNDDAKDAGEIGAGHGVTALYEIVPTDASAPTRVEVDPLRYQQARVPSAAAQSAEWLTIKLRYKDPQGSASRLLRHVVTDDGERVEETSDDFRWSAAVAAFGMLLRDSEHRGEASFDLVSRLARSALGSDPHGDRRELLDLVERARAVGVGRGS